MAESRTAYWLDMLGKSGILLGPAETSARLMYDGAYRGPYQLDEGMGALTGGLAAWNAAKYIEDHTEQRERSPLIHIGRVLEVGGPAATEYMLATGNAGNIFHTFGPAAIGIAGGAFLEYVAGPVHEAIKRRMAEKRYKRNIRQHELAPTERKE